MSYITTKHEFYAHSFNNRDTSSRIASGLSVCALSVSFFAGGCAAHRANELTDSASAQRMSSTAENISQHPTSQDTVPVDFGGHNPQLAYPSVAASDPLPQPLTASQRLMIEGNLRLGGTFLSDMIRSERLDPGIMERLTPGEWLDFQDGFEALRKGLTVMSASLKNDMQVKAAADADRLSTILGILADHIGPMREQSFWGESRFDATRPISLGMALADEGKAIGLRLANFYGLKIEEMEPISTELLPKSERIADGTMHESLAPALRSCNSAAPSEAGHFEIEHANTGSSGKRGTPVQLSSTTAQTDRSQGSHDEIDWASGVRDTATAISLFRATSKVATDPRIVGDEIAETVSEEFLGEELGEVGATSAGEELIELALSLFGL